MSFLNDIKIYGVVAIVVGALAVLMAVYGMIDQGASARTIAPAIPGIMIIFVGFLAYTGKTRVKRTAVANFLLFVGIGIFVAACLGVYGENLALMVGVIAGLIAAYVGFMLYKNRKLDNIWWILLVVVFLLLIIFDILSAFDQDHGKLSGILRAVSYLLHIVLYVYIMYFLFSDEVKRKFN